MPPSQSAEPQLEQLMHWEAQRSAANEPLAWQEADCSPPQIESANPDIVQQTSRLTPKKRSAISEPPQAHDSTG
jgi:hypothetical protein